MTIDEKKELCELAIKLRDHLAIETQNTFGYIFNSAEIIFADSNHPNKGNLIKDTNTRVQGMLVIYLFAIWESYFGEERPNRETLVMSFLTPEEKTKFRAFKHIRHTSAHKINGERARQCKIDFENLMYSESRFINVNFNTQENLIDFSESEIGADCWNFMHQLTVKLSMRIFNE